jgi:hypothetical protein
VDELRSKVRALLQSSMPEDTLVDFLIDVIDHTLQQARGRLGGRPRVILDPGKPVTNVKSDPKNGSSLTLKTGLPPEKAGFQGQIRRSESSSGSDLTLFSDPPDLPDLSKQIRGDDQSDGPLPRGFGDFWAAYPKKVAKADAIAAWKKHKPPLALVLLTLAWQKRLFFTERKYTPHPASWLNAKRWQDEEPAEEDATGPVMSDHERANAAVAARFVARHGGKPDGGR